MFLSWLRSGTRTSFAKKSQACRKLRFSAPLRLEALEDRWMPTTVTNLLDSGAGSLRDAIASTPTGGIIDFQAGLTGTITLTSGELVINNKLTITGPGAGSLAISGGNTSRVFDLPASTSSLALFGLTIENGSSVGTGAVGSGNTGWGGGIENYGTLSITNCTITGNYANFGGAGIDNWGPFTISGSVVSNNTTNPSLGGGGGGIYTANGTVTATGDTFTGNSGQGGGAIINNSGTLLIDSSTFSQNHAGVGGGVFNVFGKGTITNSTFSGNYADTSAGYAGGGIANGGSGTLTVAGCTLTGNSAGTPTIQGGGGGIFNQDSTLTLTNSTLYGNTAYRGGGIENHYSVAATVLTVSNTTISGNSATQGGGVANDAMGIPPTAGTLNALDTIFAGNTATTSPDVSGVIASQGHNLIGIGAGASGYAATDLVGTLTTPINPNLGPLQNNGGPTQTMALLPGSPAINAGDNTGAPQYDQRGAGYPRIVGGTIDIGAFEVQTVVTSVSPSVTVNPVNITYGTPLNNAQLSGSATATVNGQVVNVAGSFAYTSAAGTVLSAGNGQIEQVTFTPADTVSFNTVVTTVTVNVQQARSSVTWPTPAAITYGTALGATQLDATANIPGTFVYTPATGSVLAAGTRTLSVTFTPTDSVNYSTVTQTVQLLVNQATPVFSNLSSPTIMQGTATTSLSGVLSAGSVYPAGDSVSITLNGVTRTAIVDASGNFSSSFDTSALVVSGSPYAITYAFAGDAVNFNAATNGSGTLTLAAANLSATGVNVSATAGAPFTAIVATFTSPDPAATAASYSASISWGDGSTSAGVISGTGSKFKVTGTHTYADPGTDTVQVTISHSVGYTAIAMTSSIATVSTLGHSVGSGQSKEAEFWHTNSGQALILSFNGGASHTELANWLSTNFANLYGAGAGVHDLAGLTNANVAALFQKLWQTNADSLDVQVLTTALNVYASTTSLGGAQGALRGFKVSAAGLGARTLGVQNSGAAFGVANHSYLNVFELLVAVNKQANNGVLYSGDGDLQDLAELVFESLNGVR